VLSVEAARWGSDSSHLLDLASSFVDIVVPSLHQIEDRVAYSAAVLVEGVIGSVRIVRLSCTKKFRVYQPVCV
jgi:hypothetical protein